MSGDFISTLRDLIPEKIPGQKRRMNTGPIFNGCGTLPHFSTSLFVLQRSPLHLRTTVVIQTQNHESRNELAEILWYFSFVVYDSLTLRCCNNILKIPSLPLLGLVKMVYYVQQSVLFFRIEYYLKLGSFKA